MSQRVFSRSFRLHLLFSHILPLLIFIPASGFALVYFLENQVFLPIWANEMVSEGTVIADRLGSSPQDWVDPTLTQSLLDRLSLTGTLNISLLDPQARLLATNQTEAHASIGQPTAKLPGRNDQNMTARWGIIQPDSGNARILAVIIPVTGADHQLLGLLQLSRPLDRLANSLQVAQGGVIAVLLLSCLVSANLAMALSTRLNRPLKQMIRAIRALSTEDGPAIMIDPGLSELDGLVQAAQQLQEHLLEAQNTRQQILASLVHELGRPLGSIQIAAHALLTGAEANSQLRQDLLQGLSERIELFGNLINDLAIAYLPHQTLELHQLPFRPCPWLNSMMSIWAEMARQKGIEWYSSWPDDLASIEGDPIRLEQALGNLVNNAFKFTPAGGRISIHAGMDKNCFWVSVTDNGPGICREDLPHLFEPFFRAQSTQLTAPGLGLGLPIARSIVETHGGTISVLSCPEYGSVFTLKIPCQP